MIERAESVHGFLVVFRQKQLFDLITVGLCFVWINDKAGKAVPILLEKLNDRKNVRIGVVGDFCSVARLFVSRSDYVIEKTAPRHCSTLREELGDFPCHPATTRDVDEVFKSPRAGRMRTVIESCSYATIDGVF